MRTFVINYRDLSRWDPGSFTNIEWHWPDAVMRPIGAVLVKRVEKLDLSQLSRDDIQFITIHFDGSIEPRALNNGIPKRMELFRAYPRDIVLSKIDLKNGAVGVLPSLEGKVTAVTSHFAVYQVTSGLLPEYFTMIIQNPRFKEYLWRKKVGAEGRKEVKLEFFESTKIPVPSLSVQRDIIKFWENTQQQATGLRQSADWHEKEIGQIVMQELGLKESPPYVQRGPFIVNYNDVERWDTYFFRKEFLDVLAQLRHIGAVPLGKCAHFVSRKWTPTDFPSGFFTYIQISDVNKTDGIVGCSKVEVRRAPSRAAQVIRQGDLLISTTRPYLAAFANVTQEYDGSVVSSAFAVVENTIQGLDKDFLLLYLKSYAGLKQFEQRMTGGLYPAIVRTELEKLLIPVPPLEKQRHIVETVEILQESIKSMKRTAVNVIAEAKIKLDAVIGGERNIKDVANG